MSSSSHEIQVAVPSSTSLIGERVFVHRGELADKIHLTRILVLDNEPHIRAAIASSIDLQNRDIHLASSVKEALDLLAHSPFDLLITDIVLSDGSGISLLEQIRALHPLLPILIVTAIQDTAVAIFAMRQGALDYLIKPFERSQLIASVERILNTRYTQQQNINYQQALEQAVTARTHLLHLAIDELEQSCDFTIEALGDALDLKDAETEGHSRRVTAYTVAIARAMGLSTSEIKVIARGAFLHDIGKMAIPDAILLKPGPLTPEEQGIMRMHCERGYSIVQKIPFLREAADIVYSHQENFDGSGYPRGLCGTQIPIGARIFSIADALDAITSDRPYRAAHSFEYACQEIARAAGTQFDPGIVKIFLQIPSTLWQDLQTEILNKSQKISPLTLTSNQVDI